MMVKLIYLKNLFQNPTTKSLSTEKYLGDGSKKSKKDKKYDKYKNDKKHRKEKSLEEKTNQVIRRYKRMEKEARKTDIAKVILQQRQARDNEVLNPDGKEVEEVKEIDFKKKKKDKDKKHKKKKEKKRKRSSS